MVNFCPKCGNKVEGNLNFCTKCGNPLNKEARQKNITPTNQEIKEIWDTPKNGEIKCPYCNRIFRVPKTWYGETKIESPTSTSGNIARGVVFLPWGIVSAVKNKKFIQCPHCGMKIMQG
ncbi:MAG: zinc ribbon domain-containing protein [Candidatus Thermoplasmatota archaeon]|nr:zinc ribbon domain-containing protein [Candidatus Thermoplasmatota archaeon]